MQDVDSLADGPRSKQESRRRLNLILPDSVYAELERASRELGVSEAALARQLLRFGLAALKISRKPGGGVFIKEPGGELEKVLLFIMPS